MEDGKQSLTFGKTDFTFPIDFVSWFSYFEAMLMDSLLLTHFMFMFSVDITGENCRVLVIHKFLHTYINISQECQEFFL